MILRVLAGIAMALTGASLRGEGPRADLESRSASTAEGFDRDVAPLLAGRCLECHDSVRREGNLDLTSRASALAGGDGGPAIVPGDPERSLLWSRVSAGEMPPDGRAPLGDDERERLRAWIRDGARWGTDPIERFGHTTEMRAGRDWWAFRTVRRPEPPAVEDESWPRNEIDFFVLSKLEAHGLSPSPEADRRTLIRRLHFDLIGLPPTPEEVDAFIADESPDAYERLVERLLDSPHYGERWARHWLDVVRFGESQGFQRNWLRSEAWKYRDWVILALNDDMPYDEFVRRQIAGDVLLPDDPAAVVATGYLVAGPYNLEGDELGSDLMRRQFREEELADNVATLGQTFLGLTIHCARCHDHKFAPIAQREYYQVASALATFRHNHGLPRDVEGLPDDSAERRALRVKMEPLRAKMRAIEGDFPAILLREAETRRHEAIEHARAEFRDRQTEYDAAVESAGVRYLDADTGLPVAEPNSERTWWIGVLRAGWPLAAAVGVVLLFPLPPVRRLVRRVARPVHVAVLLLVLGVVGTVRAAIAPATSPETADSAIVAEAIVTNEVNQAQRARAYAEIALRNLTRSRASVDPGEILEGLPFESRDEYRGLIHELSKLEMREALLAGGATYAVVPDQPLDPLRVLEQGDVLRPADEVVPSGVAALGIETGDFGLPADAADSDRRIALARWITDSENPLTDRVLVNRVWTRHFGRGFVALPSDFGIASGEPTHPELLDFLVQSFRANGKRPKALHRMIVTSAAYRQESRRRPQATAIDPENRFVWRHSPARHEAETLRDAVLSVSGALDLRMGGPGYRDFEWKPHHPVDAVFDVYEPIDPFGGKYNRRSIYRTLVRSANNALLSVFDCADPSISTPARAVTTTPLQALSLLNNPFMEQAAERFAERLEHEAGRDSSAQVERAYRLALLRLPEDGELAASAEHVARYGLAEFCLLLFNCNEFLYVD
ncbi:MAG: PSD1 and planctomycete cytochrome C domain-containing protein [Planctomycetaceae bacterium]